MWPPTSCVANRCGTGARNRAGSKGGRHRIGARACDRPNLRPVDRKGTFPCEGMNGSKGIVYALTQILLPESIRIPFKKKKKNQSGSICSYIHGWYSNSSPGRSTAKKYNVPFFFFGKLQPSKEDYPFISNISSVQRGVSPGEKRWLPAPF